MWPIGVSTTPLTCIIAWAVHAHVLAGRNCCEHGLLCQTRDVQKRRNHACGWRAYRLRSQEAFAAHKRDQLNGRSRTMEQQCRASAHRPVPDHPKCRPTLFLRPALPAQAAGEPSAQPAGQPAVQASGYQRESWATCGDPHGGPCCSQLPLLLQVCPATDHQTCLTGHCLQHGVMRRSQSVGGG